MSILLLILISNFLISLISLVGIFFLSLKKKLFEKIILIFVALSAGALMGGAFLHLIPEAVEKFPESNIFFYTLIGFAFFFLVEKVLHWRHCHQKNCKIHTFAYMSIFGECIHNLIDGLIIAASFVTSIKLGIVTSLAVVLHEIPQEFGDFSVLVYGGFSKMRALLINFIIAMTAVIGGLAGYFLSFYSEYSIMFLLPFAAGGFIYISASDLIPELTKEANLKKSIITFIIFLIGISIIYLLRFMH